MTPGHTLTITPSALFHPMEPQETGKAGGCVWFFFGALPRTPNDFLSLDGKKVIKEIPIIVL